MALLLGFLFPWLFIIIGHLLKVFSKLHNNGKSRDNMVLLFLWSLRVWIWSVRDCLTIRIFSSLYKDLWWLFYLCEWGVWRDCLRIRTFHAGRLIFNTASVAYYFVINAIRKSRDLIFMTCSIYNSLLRAIQTRILILCLLFLFLNTSEFETSLVYLT